MNTTFDWKQLSKELPVCHKYVIIYGNRKGKAKWFFGFYNGVDSIGSLNAKVRYHEFDVREIDLSSFNKQNTIVTRHVLETDASLCYWDYYNPHWKAPNTFDDVEDFFYKP